MRFLFIILIISLSTLISYGQNSKNESSSISLKRFTRTEILIGPSLIAIRDNNLNQYQTKAWDIGFAAGLGKSFIISRNFQLTGRVFYEKKGGKHFNDEQVGNVIYRGALTEKQIYTCITVPLTISYGVGHRVRYQFEIGPFLSYSLSAAVSESSSVSNYKVYFDRSDEVKSVDYGCTFVFGVSTPIYRRTNDLSIRLINNWGIPNVLNSTSDTWRTFSLILMIGYPIPKI